MSCFLKMMFQFSFLLIVILCFHSTAQEEETAANAVLEQQQTGHDQHTNDGIEVSMYDPLQADPDSCQNDTTETNDISCWQPPDSTVEVDKVDVSNKNAKRMELRVESLSDNIKFTGIRCCYGGEDPDETNILDFVENNQLQCLADAEAPIRSESSDNRAETSTLFVDKHWGSDPTILRMRDRLRLTGSGESNKKYLVRKQELEACKKEQASSEGDNTLCDGRDSEKDVHMLVNSDNRRPPIFLLPGLASTRLVAWRKKNCKLSEIKVKDNVWLNLNLIMQMSTIDVECLSECLKLGWNQSDTDDINVGCKLRPDEGLDAISSLAPEGFGATNLIVGGTNTVYAWLIQWLADNLGYDVTNIIGLPYDWRLSPDKMESRDGFLTLTRRRIEAAVQSNGGQPGIIVAHSMGNLIFRYFLNWLRSELRKETYAAKRKRSSKKQTSVLTSDQDQISSSHDEKLRELSKIEGDDAWNTWIETHVWTYVGLSAPLLGAVNPLRSVISGESMGLPVSDEAARWIELTFGSTHTVNPVDSQQGFCDEWDINDGWDEEPDVRLRQRHADSKLACLDDIMTEIEISHDQASTNRSFPKDPMENFPALSSLLRKRAKWTSDIPMMRVIQEACNEKERQPCADSYVAADFGPVDVQNGEIFTRMSQIWKERGDPLILKRDQLRESFLDTKVKNILNETWDRPLIKHVVMAYGVDISTEVGYEYRKSDKSRRKEKNEGEKGSSNSSNKKKIAESSLFDGIPTLSAVVWETEGGLLVEERIENHGLLGDLINIRKSKKAPLRKGIFHRSGDGSVPYLSLAWAHTWLLHAARALRYTSRDIEIKEGDFSNSNPLDDIGISHRPKGATEWVDGPPPGQVVPLGEKKIEQSSDTGTAHPHGTKYKPEMVRYHNIGKSRTTGIEYTTTVIEAIGVEHKETTRNYDILAAVFTDVLKFMHDDFKIV